MFFLVYRRLSKEHVQQTIVGLPDLPVNLHLSEDGPVKCSVAAQTPTKAKSCFHRTKTKAKVRERKHVLDVVRH